MYDMLNNKSGVFWETLFPLFIAIFASILAINDLLSDNVASTQIKLGNSRNDAFQWFQSKGIKEIIVKGQFDLINVLVESDAIAKEKSAHFQQMLEKLNEKKNRYHKEKKEILLGSKVVGPENWAQDIDGKMGAIIGATEYDGYLQKLELAENNFDYASMLLQISMVLGAVGIMVDQKKIKLAFFIATISIGAVGFSFTAKALLTAQEVPFD